MSEKNMTQGNIVKQLLIFSFPVLLAQLLQQFYSMTDAAILGHFAESRALAAIGSGSLLLSVLLNFFTGFTTGIGVLIAQYFGGRDYKKLKDAIQTALMICISVGILFTIVGMTFSKEVLLFLNTPESVLDLARLYFNISCLGIVAQMITSAGTAILRALGNTKSPLYILGCTCILNVVLDVLLVGVFNTGIRGAAYATLFAQLLSMVLILYKIKKLSVDYRPSYKPYLPTGFLLKTLLVLGIPSGMQAVFMSISSLVIQTSINSFGAEAIAGMTVFAKVEGFLYYPLFSLGLALSGFIGQNCGAKEEERINLARKNSLILSVGFAVVASIFTVVLCNPLLSLFTTDTQILDVGREAVYWILPFYFLYAINQVYISCLRGTGHTFCPMLITLACYSVFRVVWCSLLLPYIKSMVVIYTSYTVSWVIMLGLLIFAWHKCRELDEAAVLVKDVKIAS